MKRILILVAVLFAAISVRAQAPSLGAHCNVVDTGNNTYACAMGTTTTGSTFVCGVWFNNASSTATIADNKSNSYTLKASKYRMDSSSNYYYSWYKYNATGGATTTITVTFASATPGRAHLICTEVAGAITASDPLDQYKAPADFTGTTISMTTTGSVAQANELVLAMGGDASAANTYTAGAGYTQIENTTRAFSEYKAATNLSGTQTATFTVASGGAVSAELWTFKGPAAAPATPTPRQAISY